MKTPSKTSPPLITFDQLQRMLGLSLRELGAVFFVSKTMASYILDGRRRPGKQALKILLAINDAVKTRRQNMPAPDAIRAAYQLADPGDLALRTRITAIRMELSDLQARAAHDPYRDMLHGLYVFDGIVLPDSIPHRKYLDPVLISFRKRLLKRLKRANPHAALMTRARIAGLKAELKALEGTAGKD